MSKAEFVRIEKHGGYGFVKVKRPDPRTALEAAAENDAQCLADVDIDVAEFEEGACDE